MLSGLTMRDKSGRSWRSKLNIIKINSMKFSNSQENIALNLYNSF